MLLIVQTKNKNQNLLIDNIMNKLESNDDKLIMSNRNQLKFNDTQNTLNITHASRGN